MPVDVQKEFADIRARYAEGAAKKRYNFLIMGDFGSGKTTLLTTAPKPVLVHSFDLNGLTSIDPEIAKGDIIPETFEQEDAKKPSQFKAWEDNFNRKADRGFFDSVGTYCIDSLTLFSDAMVNQYLSALGRSNAPLQLQDYNVILLHMTNTIKIFNSLPCHVILTSHIDIEKEEITGRMKTGPMVPGRVLKVKIPMLFDEIYVAQAVCPPGAKDTSYSLLTRPDGVYNARTRIGRGKFEMKEQPNITYLLKKAGVLQ